MKTLTEIELMGLKSPCNMADGHAYHDLSPTQLMIVNRLPELWTRAATKRHAEAEADFRDAFISLSGCRALEGYGHFRICPTASNSIDTAAAWCADRKLVVGMVEPTFDNLALLMRRRGVSLVPVAETDLFTPPEHIDALVVVTPNNPTGTVLAREEFARIVQWCATRGKTLILDNTFRFFAPAEFDPYAILLDSGVDFISIEDTGKVWPTQDLKASLIFTSPSLAHAVGEIYEETYLCVSNFALELLGEFLRDAATRGLDSAVWHDVAVRRARFRAAIAGTGLEIAAPDSRLSVEWVRVPDGDDYAWLEKLSALGLTVLPGRHFYWAGGGGDSEGPTRHLRFSLLKPLATFERALQVLEGARDAVSKADSSGAIALGGRAGRLAPRTQPRVHNGRGIAITGGVAIATSRMASAEDEGASRRGRPQQRWRASYPLGHDETEAARLDAQAQLLRDEDLERLAVPGTRMLEIGCGTGSNYPLVATAAYHGIDFAPDAIAIARARHGERFTVGDATALPFADASFDVVFTKLVLWSIRDWRAALREALRVLRPGGTLHTFELDDGFVLFEPPRPAFERRIAEWDTRAVDAGLDPFIGRKIPAALAEAGFVDVRAQFKPRLALAGSPEYAAVLANLYAFYFGASAAPYGLGEDETAEKEALRVDAQGLVMDSFFIASCTRPGNRRCTENPPKSR